MNNCSDGYDVVVAGGGLAGVSAASAAARAGARTLMIECQPFAGGVATATMEATMCNHFHNAEGERLVGGRPYELVERLVKLGATTSRWAEHGFHITFDIELAKLAMDEMLEEAGADILYSTYVTDALVEDGQVTGVRIANRSGNQVVKAGCVVDATGDADVAAQAGVPLNFGGMPHSFMFRLGNVDLARMRQFFKDNPEEYGRDLEAMDRFFEDGYLIVEHYGEKLKKTVFDAVESGRYTSEWGSFFDMCAFKMSGIRSMNTLNVNTGMVRMDCPDGRKLSDLLREGRKMSFHVAGFLKERLPGCEHSFVVATSTSLGLRRTRWLKTDFVMTDDLFGQHFEDAVGRGVTYGRAPYDLPLRCMLPSTVDGLIIGSGRSTSSDPAERLRVQPATMIVGQSAGVCAAVAVKTGRLVRDVDVHAVQDALRAQDAWMA